MKGKIKRLLCALFLVGATVGVGLFTGCSKEEFKEQIDQAFCKHNYGAIATKVVRDATCLTEGEELWTCIDCGKEKTVVLDKLEHNFTGGWTKEKQKPTCREEGIRESRCADCKTIVTESIEKLPHDEVSVEMKAPTCTEAGYTEYSYCSDCNDFVTPKVVIPALGHIVDVVKGMEATCDTKGMTDGELCSVCGEMTKEQKEIPALGHNVVYLEPVEATCEETGLTSGYACSRCDVVFAEQAEIAMKPHIDEDEDGYCDDCYNRSDHIDKNDDFFCDICNGLLVDTTSCSETELTSGMNVANRYFRCYFPTDAYSMFSVKTGVTANGHEVEFYVGISRDDTTHLWVGCDPISNPTYDIPYVVGDGYIDFYLPEGLEIELTDAYCSPGVTVTVSADWVVELVSSGGDHSVVFVLNTLE